MKRSVKKSPDEHSQNQVYRKHGAGWLLQNEGDARIFHRSRVKIKELKSGLFSSAHMRHYSTHRVYVEADTLLLPGTKIYIGIEDSPFTPYANVYDVYRAEVVSLRHLNGRRYHYGYAIKLILTHPK